MFKWFNKWFASVCRQALEEDSSKLTAGSMVIPTSRSIDSSGMNFALYRANGGYIVECRQYDRKNDRSDNKLHIIRDDQELGEEIGKIITFELLRG